jgi:hypothetical protein
MNSGSPIALHDGSSSGLYTDTTSSRITVETFSNCRESNTSVTYPTQNKPIQKTLLPWLRKAQEPFSLSQSSPPKGPTTSNSFRSSSGSTCETCVTTILDFSPWPIQNERKQTKPGKSACYIILMIFPNVSYRFLP